MRAVTSTLVAEASGSVAATGRSRQNPIVGMIRLTVETCGRSLTLAESSINQLHSIATKTK